jgi:hypothetical protein
MTDLQQAESLFDNAEREEREGDLAAIAERNIDAELHYERARVCRKQGIEILDHFVQSQQRQKYRRTVGSRRLGRRSFARFSLN